MMSYDEVLAAARGLTPGEQWDLVEALGEALRDDEAARVPTAEERQTMAKFEDMSRQANEEARRIFSAYYQAEGRS